ncbi:MAG: Flp pilus assembly complex ATPase component TadA, partial [Pirellulaceae bacterium]|nr:Flp pilus assembly complex ATPase component TadA [Pirellulaceae bacterium]
MGTILIDKLLQTVISRKASDLHITVGSPPVVRVDGQLMRLETKELEAEDTVGLMKSITPERCQQELQEVGGTDFGFAFGEAARFRVSVFKQRGYVGLVLRQLPARLMDFKEMGTPPALERLIMRPRGLILVTGPTGSGKTTTLAAAV